MVHNLPENFNISDFDVFHSALLPREHNGLLLTFSPCIYTGTNLLPGPTNSHIFLFYCLCNDFEHNFLHL